MARPWKEHAKRYEAEEGHWAEYSGWLAWMGEKAARDADDGAWWEALEGSCDLSLPRLFCIMCDLADASEAINANL